MVKNSQENESLKGQGSLMKQNSNALKTVKRKGSNVDHFEKRKFCFEKGHLLHNEKSEKGVRLENPR